MHSIETLIDELFIEPYGLDDCMEISRLLNSTFDLKKADFGKSKEELKQTKIANIHVSHEGMYIGHYRLHSENALEVLEYFKTHDKNKKEDLDNKIVSFFKSYEWETWSYKNAEHEGAEF